MNELHVGQTKEKEIMDNSIRDEGFGHWCIQTYQPDGKNDRLGPFRGNLLVDSKLYTVKVNVSLETGKAGTTVIVVPSQNVAYVSNEDPALNK
jgi:hypothetical protein